MHVGYPSPHIFRSFSHTSSWPPPSHLLNIQNLIVFLTGILYYFCHRQYTGFIGILYIPLIFFFLKHNGGFKGFLYGKPRFSYFSSLVCSCKFDQKLVKWPSSRSFYLKCWFSWHVLFYNFTEIRGHKSQLIFSQLFWHCLGTVQVLCRPINDSFLLYFQLESLINDFKFEILANSVTKPQKKPQYPCQGPSEL